jgi:hypothetical protein
LPHTGGNEISHPGICGYSRGVSIEKPGDLRAWFRERLSEALDRRRLSPSETTQLYVVELLHHFALSPGQASLDRPLALQLAEAVEATGLERIRLLRIMGDTALYLSGFFADHIEHRGLSRDYFVAMGERAYSSAGALAARSPSEAVRRPVYSELAEDFERYVNALDDVRESTVLATPQDIVKLYDRWRKTRSPRLAERLREEGVVPTDGPRDRLLH